MKVAIIGVGALGSYIAEFLARNKLELLLIDHDIVKKKNINQRFFKPSYVNKAKVYAAKKELQGMAKINVIKDKVENVNFKAQLMVDCTDNVKSRKNVFEKAKKMLKPYVFVSCSSNVGMFTIVDKNYMEFESTILNKKAEQQRSNVCSIAFIASIASMNILKFIKNNKDKSNIIYPKVLISNADKNMLEVVQLDKD